MLRTLPLLLAATLLSAQAPDLERLLNTAQLGSASKRAQTADEAPADVSVLLASELQALGYRTLGDALGGVLGFRTNEDRAYQFLGIRGLYILGDQNTRVLVLLDGHTLNSPAEVGSSKIGQDLGIPLEMVEQVEIIRGPASSLYGSNAFCAVVNVVTRGGKAEKPFDGDFACTAGSQGQIDAFLSARGRTRPFAWHLLASGFRRTGTAQTWPELQEAEIPADADREERQSAYLTLQGESWSFKGMALSRTQRLATAPFSAAVGSTGNRYRNRLLWGELSLHQDLGPWKLSARLYGDRNEFMNALAYDGIRDEGGTPYAYRDQEPDRSLGAELQGRLPLGASLMLTLGREQRWHRYDSEIQTLPEDMQLQVKYGLSNTYAQVEWDPSAAVSAVFGLQRAEFNVDQARMYVGDTLTEWNTNTLSRWTPRAALVWRPSDRDSVKFLVGQGFRNPTIFERYFDEGASYQANPDLQAERLSSVQLLWARQWSARWHSQVSFTDTYWSKLIQGVGEERQQFQNASDQIHGQAAEAELRYRDAELDVLAQAGTYRWRMQDQPLPNVGETQASLRAIRRWGDFSLAGEARYVGARSLEDGSGTEAPGCTTLRFSARWQRPFGWIQATVEDATDARPWQLVSVDSDPLRRLRMDGRCFYLTLGLKL